jgi:hypothetical protein
VRLRRFEPVVAVVGTPVRLGKAAEPEGMLTRGWHKPEAWGCWTSGLDAELRLSFVAPLVGSFRLEMDLSVPGVCPELTVLVSGVALPGVMPVAGRNAWVLPDGCLDGRQDVSIELRVSSTVRPAQQNGSVDNRTLGIGVRSVGLHREAASVCPIGSVVRISSALGDSGMLLDGWHKPERWGCWSSGRSASMRLQFDKPLRGSFGIEVNMMPPLRDGDVLMEVNGVVLGASRVREGANEWSLPLSCTDGQNVLDLRFIVEDPVRPMDVVKGSVDDRIIGVGIKSLMVYPE